jgi:hypothetical protein
MPIGDVVEGRGGVRYVQVGENAKDKASWKPVSEVSSVPSKPYTPSGHRPDDPFGGFSLGKAYEVAKRLPTPLGVNTLVSDLMDKAAYNAGGYVTDKASILGASPETAALLGYGTNVATQAIPSIIGGKAIEAASKPAAQGVGRWLMQKAVHPSKESLMTGKAQKAIETFLTEGRNVTSGGMGAMADEVGKLSTKVDDVINAAQSQGKAVSIASILSPVANAKAGHWGKQYNNADDIAAINKTLTDFLTDPRIAGKSSIPIREAQDIKSATYKALGEKVYGKDVLPASVAGQKAGIQGMKEGIERAAPEVIPMNQRMSKLLNAIEVAEPGILMSGNKNVGGLAYLAENPFAAGGFMLDRSDLVKSILARLAYTGVPNAANVGTASILGAHMQ